MNGKMQNRYNKPIQHLTNSSFYHPSKNLTSCIISIEAIEPAKYSTNLTLITDGNQVFAR
jgi:hypothetical protein